MKRRLLPQELAQAIKLAVSGCSAVLDGSISALMQEADPRQIAMCRRLVGKHHWFYFSKSGNKGVM